ncbi:MAG: hypothetical protein WBL02_10375 [Methanomethylovorans sp.]|uniref:hypothetical protein n=1 Tax=Methanomethylovorans sp. TaxID=2758717 RepID=UPI000ACF6915|nr:hypothetical protein [Methanomethylovorans sp.]
MRYQHLLLILFIFSFSIYASGCSGQEHSDAVNTTVIKFLEAVNAEDYNVAFGMYEGKDFLVPASIGMTFKNKKFSPGGLKEVLIISEEHTENVAVATAECTVAKLNDDGNEIERAILPIYFKLQYTELGWIIIRVTFSGPLELSEDDLVTVEVQRTPIDPITENALPITIFSVMLFGSGIYLNQREKQKHKNNSRTVDTSNGIPMPKESLAQFIMFVPSQKVVAGGKTVIDVWIKNFSQQPYEKFAIKARFPNTVEIKDTALFFDPIPAGQTVKQSWTFVPRMQGWLGVEEPTVVFEYLGTKYTGTLDTIWIPVQ